jgi:hypothetical protein
MILANHQSVSLAAGQQLQISKTTVPPLTDSITVTLKRSTTAAPLAWQVSGIAQIAIVLVLDGVEHRCQGRCSGGIKTLLGGSEAATYVLKYAPTVFMDNGTPRRIGEIAQNECAVYVTVDAVGDQVTSEITVETGVSPAPNFILKNSVAYDASTDAQEFAGDGVISLSHTSTGANRAVLAAFGNSASSPQNPVSCTYGGTGMTQVWSASDGSFCKSAAYRLVAQATGAQTVQASVAAGTDQMCLAVISMTGVDQTAPVGTPATSTSISGTPSVTVASPGSSDMVVDFLMCGGGIDDTSAAGANQTKRTSEVVNNTYFATSTQSGADGGVMSWSLNTTPSFGTILGAVNFIAAGGGGAATIYTRTPLASPIFKSRVIQ